ncbi:hypothetical protein M4R22_10200 [Acidovorax sp. GBBC 3334]|uniref:hypothetical protein n=1 Tax=Acidovorax sp. GBBC 3334 TaxID=2940496 RepID=UPI0023031F78|nr:hypothetical protein [Acidovorax sp. GBBC 3334]MDA8455135.1 hypothetical protein [Acidovorax sp. GBBC 3334]
MKEISIENLKIVSGGMDLSNGRQSDNVIDLRGNSGPNGTLDNGTMCYPSGTNTSVMFPNGANDGDAGSDY